MRVMDPRKDSDEKASISLVSREDLIAGLWQLGWRTGDR